MSKKIQAHERKRSVTFSLSEQEISTIEAAGEGKTLSEKLVSLLSKTDVLVRFDSVQVDNGLYEPEFKAPHAFMVYQKSQDGYETGDLPAELVDVLTPKTPIIKMQSLLKEYGYSSCLIEFKEVGFISLWARAIVSPCVICRDKIFAAINKVVKL